MKIRLIKFWTLIGGAVIVLAVVIGVVSLDIAKREKEMQAHAEELGAGGCEIVDMDNIEYEDVEESYNTKGTVSGLELEGESESNLPLYYDARDHYNVRTKNQHTEGLCWLYASVTALEYNIAKNYGAKEISNKRLDYSIIVGEGVYKGANNNPYFDRYLNGAEAYRRTFLGTAGSTTQAMYGFLDPLGVVSENDFTNILKENDSRLARINRYEDLWNNSIISEEERNNILERNGDGYPSYLVRQDYDKVNNPELVDYVVTGARIVDYSFDESRTKDSETVRAVKGAVANYGALKVSAKITNVDTCADKKTIGSKSYYTIISTSSGDCRPDHGMVIVGWDDEWEYQYNGETKYGAYILQNSWGENESDKMRWHLGYISTLPASMYIDSVEEYDSYDEYHGPKDYKIQSIEPADDEYVFELSSDGEKSLKAIVFDEQFYRHDYDVYVSTTGESSDFVKDGVLNARRGITKYTFANEYDVNDDYAIKLKRTDGSTVSLADKNSNTMNVLVDDYSYDRILAPYVIEGYENYLDLTTFHNDIDEFEELFGDRYNVVVNTKMVDGTNALYTGGTTKIYENGDLIATYTNIIRGDTNGDGNVGVTDYIRVKKDIMSIRKLQGEYRIAGDVNKDNKIGVQDYIKVKKMIMRGGSN